MATAAQPQKHAARLQRTDLDMNSSQMLSLAVQHHQAGNLGQAETLYRNVLQSDPRNPDALHSLGMIACQFERHHLAVELIQAALRERPTMAAAHSNLGISLQAIGQLNEAVACYRYALQLNPTYAEAHTNLGNALQELGDFEAAEQAFRAALRLDPGFIEALWGLATQLRGKLSDADRAALEKRVAEPSLNNTNLHKIHFALAQVCDAKGDYESAAAHLKKANALLADMHRKRGKTYDLAKNARYIDNCVAKFTPEFFARVRGFGSETKQPVFIVGLPRSGTTLTEQIIAAHSQAVGVGELFLGQEDFRTLAASSKAGNLFASLDDLQPETVRRLAQQHLDQLWKYNRTAERIVDKMPDNYLYLGLLAVLFPKATFIHCRRDLRDTAFSCWMNPLPCLWSNTVEDLTARIREYQRLMGHWRLVLPVPLLEVDYEETVADLPGVARRLVEFCGLPWEEGCLKFNEGARQVRTASKVQVREPVYKSSIARWRHYERDLSELFAALTPLQEKGGGQRTSGEEAGAGR